jgi:hypothetical protein
MWYTLPPVTLRAFPPVRRFCIFTMPVNAAANEVGNSPSYAAIFGPVFWGMPHFCCLSLKATLTHQFLWEGFCITLMSVGCFPNLPHGRSLSILARLFGVSILQGYLYFTRYHDRPWLRCLVSEISSNVKFDRLPPRPLACCEYALSETRSTLIVSLALSIVYR